MTADRPPVIGLCHAGAEGVYEEAYQALTLLQSVGALVVYLACNEAGILLPDLQHWGSLHPAKFPLWEAQRKEARRPGGYVRWSIGRMQIVDRVIRNWRGGSSGLHIVDVALNGLELDGAICCGMPLDDRMNQFRREPWGAAHPFRQGWKEPETLAVLRPRVRSMSGWTEELLGAPTAEWLEGLCAR